MAEFEEKLNAILGDEQAMGQIMALARSLTASGTEDRPEQSEDPTQAGGEPFDPPGQDEAAMLRMGLELLGRGRGPGTNDRSAALLHALRPFLREERGKQLDRALQLAQMLRVFRTAMASGGGRGAEEDV